MASHHIICGNYESFILDYLLKKPTRNFANIALKKKDDLVLFFLLLLSGLKEGNQ
jgi:hypothetical protein